MSRVLKRKMQTNIKHIETDRETTTRDGKRAFKMKKYGVGCLGQSHKWTKSWNLHPHCLDLSFVLPESRNVCRQDVLRKKNGRTRRTNTAKYRRRQKSIHTDTKKERT